MKYLDGGQFAFLLLFARVIFTLLIVQVPFMVSLRCFFCFRYLDILARWFKTYRFRGWKWFASNVSVPHPTNIHFKFKMDARVQDVTEGTSYTMMVLQPDIWALYSQPLMSYEWSSFSGGNVRYRTGLGKSEIMNLVGYGSLRLVDSILLLSTCH